jgi:cobyrinic acid a,c-diamide synthase
MKLPRIMLAAPASGSGKTLITCGILQALVDRGLKVSSFKCGPDYIDPMFHSRVIGTNSRNLDAFFSDTETLKYLFSKSAEKSDISVIEGVMGFYDGIVSESSEASSYDVSEKTETPVILVVNCKGTSLSCVPIIKGFREFRKNRISGVILNNMSEKVFASIAPVVEKETGTEVIGYVPRVNDLVIESRHLGLVLPDEISELKKKLSELASVLEKTLNIGRIIEIAESAPDFVSSAPKIRKTEKPVKIGVAKDEAFCFLYEDNLELLAQCGAEIEFFSPLRDKGLPKGICGIIIPGGYPELHADTLSGNRGMLKEIKSAIEKGMPCMAECGGFMYLHEELEDPDGKFLPMVGYIRGKAFNTHRLSRFGYVTMNPKNNSGIFPERMKIKGHEFHYWDSENPGDDWKAVKTSGFAYGCIHGEKNTVLGFPHMYYYSNPEFPYLFLRACEKYGSE